MKDCCTKFIQKGQDLLNNEKFVFWLFMCPTLVGTSIFIILPILGSLGLSFFQWDLLNIPKFVELENYKAIVTEPEFCLIIKNTLTFAGVMSFLAIIIPLFLAYIINSKIRGAEIYKTLYFIPFITPMVVVAIVWEWIFDPSCGLINFILQKNIEWLYDKDTALFALVIIAVWKQIGYNLTLLIFGFALIDDSIFESAKIDGANDFQTFIKITIPLLSPSIFFVMIITIISSFQVFDLVYLITKGGPQHATNVLVYGIYQNAFELFEVGKACAMAYILFGIIFILTIAQWILRKKWVFHEN